MENEKIGLLVLMLLFIVCLSGCNPMLIYDLYEEGDYVFAYLDKDKYDKLYLYGLTGEGRQKEYLILPKECKGKAIQGFGVELSTFYGGIYYRDDFDSSVLEKIFINFELIDVYYYNVWPSFNITKSDDERNKYTFIMWYKFYDNLFDKFSTITEGCFFGNNLLNNEETKKYIAYDVYGIAMFHIFIIMKKLLMMVIIG